jgi:hypothetical protein
VLSEGEEVHKHKRNRILKGSSSVTALDPSLFSSRDEIFVWHSEITVLKPKDV